ncbi:biotin/lipoyl-binding protein [Singulisphaera sp. PoT]|uniref:HlyD family efflux transporter periplasmic adaptor subunit n=1 Tax=Singulisphaera sp. PoT TaxID=3411797 RepID=UPI003BF5F12C
MTRARYFIPVGLLGILTVLGLLQQVAAQGDQRPAATSGSSGSALVRPNPGTSPGEPIHALARLEPASGLIAVGVRPGIRVDEVRVKEGDQVKAGDILAVLEGSAQARKQVELAEAQKAGADFRRSVQREKITLDRQRDKDLYQSRHDTAAKVATSTRQKYDELMKLQGTLSAIIEKDARTKYEIAGAAHQLEMAALKAELELRELEVGEALKPKLQAQEDRELADNGPETEVLVKQIDAAREALAQTEVRATGPGLVLDVQIRPGEVSNGSLLSLGDLSAMVAKAEVYQTDVDRLAVGNVAEVLVQGRPVAGKVVRIGRIVGGNELRSLDPRALQDLRVVTVTIALESAAEASKFVRRQVDATITPTPDTASYPDPSSSTSPASGGPR